MKTLLSSSFVTIPDGVKVTVKSRIIEVVGPRGTLTRNFKHLKLDIQHVDDGKKLRVEMWFGSRKQVRFPFLWLTHPAYAHLQQGPQDMALAKSCMVVVWYKALTLLLTISLLALQLACIRTVCSHIKNLITGVTKGFLYKTFALDLTNWCVCIPGQ